GGDDYELAFTLPAHIEPPTINSSNTPVTCIGEVIAVNEADIADSLRPKLLYQGQPVTPTNSTPFATWPTLTGYQHFAG
ncbi:thiamine-phosphate kinase, partial [Psychrobacter sp. 1U2]